MKRFLSTIVLGGFFVFNLVMGYAYAGEVDLLLQKLVEKGVLSAGEAQQIGTETKEQVKKEIAEGKYSSLPAWVQNTKLKGDFRLRYEWDKDKAQRDNSRARIRVRLGVESKINNKLKMAVGIAPGKPSDPRSRNVTLGGDNSSSTLNTEGAAKQVILDYAYAEYAPFSWATLFGGKFQNPLWRPHDAFWKGDITPEGGAANVSYKLNSKVGLFLNEMFFVLKNDSRTDNRPYMNVLQPGLDLAINDKLSLRAALSNNIFMGIKSRPPFANSSASNTRDSAGNLKYNYNSIQPALELSMKEPLAHVLPSINLPYAAIFGDYVYNYSKNTRGESQPARGGYQCGLKFGNEKVNDWGQWQGKLVYSKLSRDCWPDVFTDSDRYGGKTNSQAWESILSYGLGKNTWLELDYYYATSLIQATNLGKAPAHVLQVDWNMKF
ncbi:MAG: putative porin [Candidatus Omnitrophica bacterium]|nr:putative porin [Candidatus Omnitrophota bacterium]